MYLRLYFHVTIYLSTNNNGISIHYTIYSYIKINLGFVMHEVRVAVPLGAVKLPITLKSETNRQIFEK